MGKATGREMTRYAVRFETRSIIGMAMAAIADIKPIAPHVEYRYYRWRWMAKLNALLDNWAPVLVGCVTSATYLGRVCLKPSIPLSSPNARDTLVQSRNRRDVASRVLPAFADIQTEEQGGERK